MTERILLFVWKQGNPEQDKIQKYMPITTWKFKNLFLYTLLCTKITEVIIWYMLSFIKEKNIDLPK